jgi:hypothetical protein
MDLPKRTAMKKQGLIASVGFLIAVGITLYPLWCWTSPGSDCIGCNQQYAFAWQPPTPSAFIDEDAVSFPACLVGAVTFGIILCLRLRANDQEMYTYWRARWDYAPDHSDTLLRASDTGAEQTESLLRMAQPQETAPEELLRIANEQ